MRISDDRSFFFSGSLTNGPRWEWRSLGRHFVPVGCDLRLHRAYVREPGRIQICGRADGIAAISLIPAIFLAALQTARLPGTHTSNKLVYIGSRLACAPKGTTYNYARQPTPLSRQWIDSKPAPDQCWALCRDVRSRRCSWLHFCTFRSWKQTEQVRCQLCKIRLRHAVLGMNHDVPSRGYFCAMAAHDFSQSAPYAVACHRPAERFLYAESKATHRQLVGAKEYCEVRTGAALSGAINGVKFASPHEPRLTRKVQAPGIIRA